MAKNPDKIAGNSGPCFKCAKTIFCNEITFQSEKKLQWQGQDGKAHYDKDGNCKETAQKIEQVTKSIQNQTIKLADIKLEPAILERVLKLSNKTTYILMAIEYGVREILGENANPAHIGLYVNQISDKLLKVSNLSEVLEDIGNA